MEITGTSHAPDLAWLLTTVERRLVTRTSAVLEALGGTLEEWRVTALLADGAGHPMTEVAEHALLAPPTVTKIVDRMVANDLVHRRVDEADRRRVLVFLSERGRAAHERFSAALSLDRAELAATLGEPELACLTELLAHLATRLP
ncbi:MarR family transcriptional regulator [Nonomuraea sp. K274]|uniref:MarR family transcriptional regulator n=2 Tax=Nonomuraea cypriaca TaxID=1187855 RepID=A0A931AIS4_9ACTN|nr:MarR family transcriptional regulator [Nonomuraea cypriaca]